MKRQNVESRGEFILYEIMEGRAYHSAIMPSEGDPFEAFNRIRNEEHNYRLSLVEVRNGSRFEVVPAELAAPVVEDHEYAELAEESSFWEGE